MKKENSGDVNQLNSFLRGELSAVETYNQAIDKLSNEPSVRATLSDNRTSHQERAAILREEITRRGGDPADGSGAWGAFAQLVEGGAKMFGKQAAIAALEQGEGHGRDDYKREIPNLSPDVRRIVESRLLPEQLRTHDRMSVLKHND